MTLLLGVPACGLASFTCLRFTPLRWNLVLALALIGSPFAPLPAAGAVLGILLALRFGGGDSGKRSAVLHGRRPALDERIFMACAARKTVFFDTSGPQGSGEIKATPVVPVSLPVPVTVSPSQLPP